ncbi:inositol oxygenase [Anthonomus grandis grandis]|uniref:inositol oxygenase n=1 Tax=Anthonomus grandis grandis TaxID=2921223 RepID=UPI002165EFC3|nr:inositol oxygenase [Anthonomus grandis grandis]
MRILNETSPVNIIDPSELLRPEPEFAKKNLNAFRDYTIIEDDPIQERVRKTYLEMHTNQTVDFVKGKIAKWCNFDTFQSTMKEALIKLNDLVDESDPDVDMPNIVHAFQTAERIRQDFPNDDWFHLTGLIHDVGKVMAFFDEPQWCVVGDTFVVGADWGKSIVYRDSSFHNNPDGQNPKYNTKYGIYEPNCGLDNVLISWGHDEYLYRMLKHNKTTLPDVALKMIRFHSFYPWHTGGDYEHLTTEKDQTEIKKWVLTFNRYDLYTKSTEVPDIEALWPYYESLINKYIPGVLSW